MCCDCYSILHGSLEQVLLYANGCYKYGRYQECIELINKLKDKSDKQHLLKGKALFHCFKEEEVHLHADADTMGPETFFHKHKECYSKAKETILLLGTVLDHNSIDNEASKMLDMTMMHYMIETNKMRDCHRCYLCREDILYKATSSDGAQSTTQNKSKLIASHLYPKALLDRFASAVPLPGNRKIFDTIIPGVGQKLRRERAESAGESTLYMLCQSCEDILNQHGEMWFIPHFFDKLYQLEVQQEIPYNNKLYMFCIGIIFRTLYWRFDSFINEDECYQLLIQCRDCLLNATNLSAVENKPDVHLLLSPRAVHGEDLQEGFMNQVLTSTCTSNIASFSLDDGKVLAEESVNAHFLLVHMGIINILVKFSPAFHVEIPTECYIYPHGEHKFKVPLEDTRRGQLPKGLWTGFKILAKQFEESWYEHLNKPYLPIVRQKLTQPKEETSQIFGILSGMMQELPMLQEGPTPALDHDDPKVINLLPAQFKVKPKDYPDQIIVPDNHIVVLHHTNPNNTGNETVFLVVGRTEKFTVEKPYVIWHHCQPGLLLSVGYFISTDNLCFTDYIPDDKEKFYLQHPYDQMLTNIKAKTPKVLQALLTAKGFYCIESLLFRLQQIR